MRVAVDIGGTFTDLVAVDEETGAVIRAKSDTTPGRLDEGVVGAWGRAGLDGPSVTALVHGTTAVINAITERRGVPTALVTTRGFRDVLEIGRANRRDLYDLVYRKPKPFVERRLRFEVTERMSHRGEVLTPLAEAELAAVAAELRASGVEAVAVAFLHAHANDAHERRALAVLADALPGVALVGSHEISRQWREYERTSTTVLSAYVKPVVERYLGALEQRVRGIGVDAPLYAMRSNGGIGTFAEAAATPITLLESGPVAGVTAAAALGRRLGIDRVLALDIGGTTAKTSAVVDGAVRIETLHHVESSPISPGYPVQSPVVEIVEIGAGGGSIATLDAAGALHVGPQSAGAEPGPACYGRGGTQPTLTDANLVAGRLDPDYFLGGDSKLDLGAAERALAALGAQIGLDATEVARGILRVGVAHMARALRLVTIRRGHDPRDFTLVAYGGAGPLHAALLARELGVARVVIPPGPGHFSAFGMLLGALKTDVVRTRVAPLAPDVLAPLLDELEGEARGRLNGSGADAGVERFAELRYQGQEHTLEVPVGEGPLDADALARLRAEFDRQSLDVYAFTLDAPLELVAARVAVSAPVGTLRWDDRAAAATPTKRPRTVDFDEHGGRLTAEVVERSSLAAGVEVAGPAIVEEPASTTLVLPGQVARADELGNLVVEESA